MVRDVEGHVDQNGFGDAILAMEILWSTGIRVKHHQNQNLAPN